MSKDLCVNCNADISDEEHSCEFWHSENMCYDCAWEKEEIKINNFYGTKDEWGYGMSKEQADHTVEEMAMWNQWYVDYEYQQSMLAHTLYEQSNGLI